MHDPQEEGRGGNISKSCGKREILHTRASLGWHSPGRPGEMLSGTEPPSPTRPSPHLPGPHPLQLQTASHTSATGQSADPRAGSPRPGRSLAESPCLTGSRAPTGRSARGPEPEGPPHSRDGRRPSPAGRLRPTRGQGRRFPAPSVWGAFLRGGAHPGASEEPRAVSRFRAGAGWGLAAGGSPAQTPASRTVHQATPNVRADSSIGGYGKTQVNFLAKPTHEVFRTQVKHPRDHRKPGNQGRGGRAGQLRDGRGEEPARGPRCGPGRVPSSLPVLPSGCRAPRIPGTGSAPSGGCGSLGSGSPRPAVSTAPPASSPSLPHVHRRAHLTAWTSCTLPSRQTPLGFKHPLLLPVIA